MSIKLMPRYHWMHQNGIKTTALFTLSGKKKY